MGSQRKYSIPLNKLRELLGWNETTSNDKELKEALYALSKTAIQWNLFGKDKKNRWQCFSLLSGCEIPENSGICIFELSSFLEDRFLSMGQEAYVKIDLIISKKFQSKYSLSIYCLALDYLIIEKGYSEKKFSIEELRKYLGVKEDEYKLIGHFNDRIIKPAEEEINSNSDMNIEIRPYKEGRKIVGYKLCMSLKEGRAKEYIEKKETFKQIENKQTNIFEDIEVGEIETIKTQSIKQEVKPKRENIKIENKELKEFFAEYKISITTNTIQNKLIEVKEVFKNRFEDYLIFLMNYTKQELKRTNINNISGFYVSLLKDDNQIDNYIVEMQNKEKEKEKNREKINYLVNIELKKNYDLYSSKEFDNYLIKNIDKLEKTIVEIIKTTTKAGEFFYDLILSKHKNGVIDKTLITESKAGTKGAVISHLKKYQEKLKYKALTFEEWKAKEITEEEIKEIEKNLV
jgi:plasmid replication initiation protein